MKHLTVGALLSGGAIFAFSCALGTADAQEKFFGLTSTTFKDGQMMPPKVANSRANFRRTRIAWARMFLRNCLGLIRRPAPRASRL
jgi:hypothetical protein